MSDAMMELRKLVVFEAIWGDATWRAAASAALAQMDELRTLLGANDGESTVDALHRYTAAVQLGCALKLEQHAKEISAQFAILPVDKIREVTVAALIGGATLLRQGVEAETGQQPTRYPCSATCTHDDAATPGHPERVKERSEAVTISLDSANHRQVNANGRCRHNERWAECSACDGYEEGADAMRAACWEAVQAELQKMGVFDAGIRGNIKAAIEGAAP